MRLVRGPLCRQYRIETLNASSWRTTIDTEASVITDVEVTQEAILFKHDSMMRTINALRADGWRPLADDQPVPLPGAPWRPPSL